MTSEANKNKVIYIHKRVAKTAQGISITNHCVNPQNDFLSHHYKPHAAANNEKTFVHSNGKGVIKAENLKDIYKHAVDHSMKVPIPPIHGWSNERDKAALETAEQAKKNESDDKSSSTLQLAYGTKDVPQSVHFKKLPAVCMAKETEFIAKENERSKAKSNTSQLNKGVLVTCDSEDNKKSAPKQELKRIGDKACTTSSTKKHSDQPRNQREKQVIAMTTKKPMSTFMKDISRALTFLDIQHFIQAKQNCFECSYRSVKFNVRVAKIPIKNSNPSAVLQGLVLQRVEGDDSTYSSLCRRLVVQLKDGSAF